MSVSENDVRHIASLARVGLPPERVAPLVHELNGILAHMEVLQAVDLKVTDVNGDVSGMPLRADIADSVQLLRQREDFAPSMRDGFFLVPRLDTHGALSASVVDNEGES